MAFEDVVFCGGVFFLQNWGPPVLQEEGNPNIVKDSFASRIQVRLSYVNEGAMGMIIWKELPS